jgi:hypothetical protein
MNRLRKMYLITNIAKVIKSKRIKGRDIRHMWDDEKCEKYSS